VILNKSKGWAGQGLKFKLLKQAGPKSERAGTGRISQAYAQICWGLQWRRNLARLFFSSL